MRTVSNTYPTYASYGASSVRLATPASSPQVADHHCKMHAVFASASSSKSGSSTQHRVQRQATALAPISRW